MALVTSVMLMSMQLRAVGTANSERELKNLVLFLAEEMDRSLQASLTAGTKREPALASS